jgi:hypothetical protein
MHSCRKTMGCNRREDAFWRNMIWMLDVVVIADPDTPEPSRIARSLGSVVEGVVPGLIGRALVIADKPAASLVDLCDEAGAGLVSRGSTDLAFERLQATHVLVLPEGYVMPAGWVALLESEFAAGGPLRPNETLMFLGAWQRLQQRVRNGFRRPDPFKCGGIVPQALARSCRFGAETMRAPSPLRHARLLRLLKP